MPSATAPDVELGSELRIPSCACSLTSMSFIKKTKGIIPRPRRFERIRVIRGQSLPPISAKGNLLPNKLPQTPCSAPLPCASAQIFIRKPPCSAILDNNSPRLAPRPQAQRVSAPSFTLNDDCFRAANFYPRCDAAVDRKSHRCQLQLLNSPCASCHFPNFRKGSALGSGPSHIPASICDQNEATKKASKNQKREVLPSLQPYSHQPRTWASVPQQGGDHLIERFVTCADRIKDRVAHRLMIVLGELCEDFLPLLGTVASFL